MAEKADKESPPKVSRISAIKAFMNVTKVKEDEAERCLEQAGWDYDKAVMAYFDNEDLEFYEIPTPDATEQKVPAAKKQKREKTEAMMVKCSPTQPLSSYSERPRITTLSSLRQQQNRGSGRTSPAGDLDRRIVTMDLLRQVEEDPEEGQAFYAGGSVRSGQQVLGPGKKNGSTMADSIVEEMLKAAKRQGSELVEPGEGASHVTRVKAFSGVGHVLGTSREQDSSMAGGNSDPKDAAENIACSEKEKEMQVEKGTKEEEEVEAKEDEIGKEQEATGGDDEMKEKEKKLKGETEKSGDKMDQEGNETEEDTEQEEEGTEKEEEGTEQEEEDTEHEEEDTEQEEQPVETVTLRVKLYRNGFIIDDGPLRAYDDPDNKECLEAFQQGKVPPELAIDGENKQVILDMADHRSENYSYPAECATPRPQVVAFSGVGHRLGSPTPPVSVQSSSNPVEDEARARELVKVDRSAPVTTVQVKLDDGSRLAVELNHHHTVGDLRQYIVTARPEYSATVFELCTSYPTKELNDYNATILEEDVCNSLLVQKMK